MLKIKKLKLIFWVAVLVSAGFLFASTVGAQVPQNLVVIFNPNPLFGAVNFLPGDSIVAQIEIKNKSGVSKPVAIEAINVNDPDNFGEALNLKIKEGSQTILNKGLTEFFGQGETFLSNLADNASTTYDLIVTFNSGADNDYQNNVLNNFDILVGFQGEQTPVTPPGQGGGGGVPAGLTIFNEASINVSNDSATLTWLTNYLSTSRVIWGAASEAHIFDFSSPPNYGYAHSTIDDLNKVTFHSVTLTGLTPGTTYYYRVISHASPDTVSVDHSFTTSGQPPSGEQNNGVGPAGENLTTEADNASVVNNLSANTTDRVAVVTITAPTAGEIGISPGGEEPGKILGAGEQNGVVAGAQNTCKPWPWVKIIILIIIYLALLLINYADKIKKDIREKYGAYLNLAYLVLPIVMAVMVFGVGWAWWIWLILIILYFLLLIFYFSTPLRNSWRASVALTIYLLAILMILKDYLC
ncbi:MAG: fibronectin type III domain-containing protein [Patescibacteria group bacterium]